MAQSTIIAWTDHTANPWIGCTRVSEGCRNCYAAALAANRMGRPELWRGERQVAVGMWREALRWQRAASEAGVRRRVFCGSMCDWAEDHPIAAATRPRLWELIRATPDLDWQLLSKRPERIAELLPADWGTGGYANVWLGTSIEDARVVERAAHLVEIPAVVRFVSYEPAIGPLAAALAPYLGRIDWVITGGESGPRFRPMDLAWAHEMRAACRAAGVAYFFKQAAAARTERGIDALGEVVREYPTPRRL